MQPRPCAHPPSRQAEIDTLTPWVHSAAPATRNTESQRDVNKRCAFLLCFLPVFCLFFFFFFALFCVLPVHLQNKFHPLAVAGEVFNLHYALWQWQKGEESGLCLRPGNGIRSREKSISLGAHARETGELDASWHTIKVHCTLGAL